MDLEKIIKNTENDSAFSRSGLVVGGFAHPPKDGMTILEYFTKGALEGLCANSKVYGIPDEVVAKKAVKLAKETIKQLVISQNQNQ